MTRRSTARRDGPREAVALGIDVGTTETKVGAVRLDGRLVALARRRHATRIDTPMGRAEQDQQAWWREVQAGIREVVDGLAGSGEIVGIGLAGHGPTLAAVDAEGRPVAPAITWQDLRPADDAEAMRRRTGVGGWGLGILPAAAWLERSEPGLAGQARWYLNTWEAVGLRLTGEARTTHLPTARPLPRSTIEGSAIVADRIPPPIATGEVLGRLRPAVARRLGLPPGVPVVAGLVDAHASLHGARMLEGGDAIDVGGAAGGFGMYWATPLEAQGSFTAPGPLPGRWLVGGAFAATGAALEWFRSDVIGGRRSFEELIAAAAAVAPGADGLVFLPYLAGERSPLWDASARGAFVGLTLQHGRAAMTRAILEAAAFAIRHLAVGIEAAGGRVRVMRACGGPAQNDAWNRIKADITGYPVEVPCVLDTAVVGATIVAATGVRAQPSLETAIRSMTAIERRIEPDPAVAPIYAERFRTYLGLYPAIRGAAEAAELGDRRNGTLARVPAAARP